LRGASSARRPVRSKETPTMLANFENVLDRLNVDDRNSPSLSLKAQDGKLLLNCFAGCRPEEIVSEIGLQMKDLFVEGGGGP
jgi:hypothetical protein